MNGGRHRLFDGASLVDGIAQHIHDAAQRGFAYRHRNGVAGIANHHATAQAVRRSQRDGADDAVTQLLLNFKRQRRTLHLEGVIHLGHVRARKLDVHDSADALNNFSLNLGHICSNTEFLYIDAVRGFPEIKRLLRLPRFPSARS